MFEGIDAYPLTWPVGWPRTADHHRKLAQFADRSLASAREIVLDELRLLKARNPILSTNVILRRDGFPRSGQRNPNDPGVAVYFALGDQPKVLACDKWTLVEDNLWAIAKHVGAIRGQQRWGVGTVDQAFMGYDALPAPASAWWEVLEVAQDAGAEAVREAYRRLAKRYHPDAGGSSEAFLRIQKAYERFRDESGGKA